MKKHVLMMAFSLCLATSAHADVIDLFPAGAGTGMSGWGEPVRNLSITKSNDIVTLPSHMSELPEPAVMLMMLVGLVLIGVRARRDSSDKFK